MKYLSICFLLCLFSCSQKLSINPVQVLAAENKEIPVIKQDDIKILLAQTDEKVHVVNFWATWCGPCVKELPYFEELNEKHGDDVKVTLVSLDFEDSLESALVPFVNKKKLSSDVVAVLIEDESKFIESINADWAGNIPATVIYYKKKKRFIEGKTTYNELIKEIEQVKKLN